MIETDGLQKKWSVDAMLSSKPAPLERLSDGDMTDDEHTAFEKAENEYAHRETMDIEDYLQERGLLS